MDTKVAVSYSTVHDSFKAGSEMSHKALSEAGLKKCQFAFVFASSEYDSKELLKGVISVLGKKTLIVGGTSAGVITGDYMGYEGFHAGILLIESDEIFFNTSPAEKLNDGEYEAGLRLGKYISSLGIIKNPNLLLLYDGMRSDPESNIPLYEAVPLLAGIKSEIDIWPPVAGVGFSLGLDKRKTEVWDNRNIFEDSAIALVISGNVRMDTTIMHGLRPASDYHKITKATKNILFEFDGRPAIEVAEEYLGNPEEINWANASYLITMGVNKGEKYGPFVEDNYLNRMILGVDQNTGALIAIEGDLNVGDEFQFMRRCGETDMVADMAQRLLDSLVNRKPLFAFYISCLGRVKKFFGTDKEESDEIRNVIGPRMPLIGIYSGVEIARIRDEVIPLDWTGVLCVFSKPVE